MSERKAVILAAGKSTKFFPPLYDRPKGLFEFQGEVLIERQIRQLLDAGISDITIVIGYEKERFFYLEKKFGIKLIVSTRYNDESNLSSVDLVRNQLKGAFLCCSDHWYKENPFRIQTPTKSIRLVAYEQDAHHELVVNTDNDGRLTELRSGSSKGMCMTGYAYLTEDFTERFFELYDKERDYLGIESMLWEQFWGRHCDELPLYGETAPAGFREFDSLEDFRSDDSGILINFSRFAITNICNHLNCSETDISKIVPLNAGLTNVSFSFQVNAEKYVYRHPGASSLNMVDRDAEVIAQRKALELGIDYSVIDIDQEGWKLSRFIDSDRSFSYKNPEDFYSGIDQIKLLHESEAECGNNVDLLAEGDRLMQLASSKKGEIIRLYSRLHGDLTRLWHYLELDEWPRVLCHNDIYAVNWIVGQEGLCLIDWEYAGMNDPMNDLATMAVRDELPKSVIDQMLSHYFGHVPVLPELRHAYGVFALSSWYWMAWSLYKDTLGEDGFFMLPCWRGLNYYLPLALSMYSKGNK